MGKGLRTPKEFAFGGHWELITELPQTGERDFWRAQTKPCAHQNPGERSSVHTRYWVRFACESPGVSSGCMCQRWPAAVSGTLTTTVQAKILLKEVAITAIIPTIVWPQAKQQTGSTDMPINRNWIKDLWACQPPSEQDLDYPTVSLFHQEESTSIWSLSIRE